MVLVCSLYLPSVKNAKVNLKDVEQPLIVMDSFCAHYHYQLMNTPANRLASESRQLLGRLEYGVRQLWEAANETGAPVLITTWIASKVASSMREHELGKIEEMIARGITPSYAVLKRYESDLTDHVGGQALGYLSKYIVRLYVEDQETRVAVLEKRTFLPSMIAARYAFKNGQVEGIGDMYRISAQELADLKRKELERAITEAKKRQSTRQ